MNIRATSLVSCVSAALLLCGCESSKPVPNSGFLKNPELMKPNQTVGVQRVWKDPSAKMLSYDKIIVRPVRTDFMVERTDREKRNIRSIMGVEKDDVAEFAKYTENAFKKTIAKGPCRLKLAEEPGPGTLALEIAFVKIVPAKPFVNAAKTVLSCNPIGACFIPIKYAAKGMTDSPAQASLAIEGRIVDSETGDILVMFAQRNKELTAILNVQDFSAYGNLEEIVDNWAKKFVEAANKRPLETGEKIEADSNFTIINF
jgi:hypothetical protein